MTRSVLFHCTTWLTGFVACAIADEKFAPASKATVMLASNRVSISEVRDVDVSVSASRSTPAATIRRSGGIAARWRPAVVSPPR